MKKKHFILILVIILIISLLIFIKPIRIITGFVSRIGQLQIGNSPPAVDIIYLNDQEATDIATDLIINPTANTTTSVIVKAKITDNNGNCNLFTANNATAYFCPGTGPCNSDTATHIVFMNYDSDDGQWGENNIYCNMTGTSENFQFYEINGTWKVNVTLTDGFSYGYLTKNWTYNELRSFTYPPSGNTVNMGVLTLGMWNNGTAGDLIQNSGNIVLDLMWNATDFIGQSKGQIINITGTNNTYIIDDDPESPDDTNNIPEAYINQTQKHFNPSSGLLKCQNVACNNENATMNVYWHINIPLGLSDDIYTNTIEIESLDHSG